MYPGPGGNRGEFIAWDGAAGKKVWGVKERFPVWSGALVTAGDVVFYGTMDGWFKAVDARSGKVLWQFKTGSGNIGNPSATPGPTASSTSPCTRASAAGRVPQRCRMFPQMTRTRRSGPLAR